MSQYTTLPQTMQRAVWGPDGEPAHLLFTNRELSWLAFNRRVLREATNEDNPLLERVRFLSITASNLDEFFMVRYASMWRKVRRGGQWRDPSGQDARTLLDMIGKDAHAFMREQLDVLAALTEALRQEGVQLLRPDALSARQLSWTLKAFREEIMPRLTLHRYSPDKPLPYVDGRALQVGLMVERKGNDSPRLVTVQMPAKMQRLWRLPDATGGGYVLVEEIIQAFAQNLVPGEKLIGCWTYRVTRDEDFAVEHNASTRDLIALTEKSLKQRKTGTIVRLEVGQDAPRAFADLLCKALGATPDAVFRLGGPLDLTFLSGALYKLDGRDDLRYQSFTGRMPARLDGYPLVFDALRDGDLFLHHPYDSFGAVLRFIREAATDPRVLAINITLYRVSGNSPVIMALCDAAEAGKRVTVLLELKARFDEENNIHWAKMLRKAGCEVIYGMPRLKTHSKITLVVRREGDGLRRYVHLGTGNYNDVTAKVYTDMGLMTCDPQVGEDAQAFFNMITGFSKEPTMHRLIYAPRMLRQSLTALIEAEIAHARAGRRCGIMAKMNALTDPGIIRQLYEASAAGVPVRLIVRGVCCLRAGVEGVSERIEVRSIVGRFLEHSRVFRFENGGDVRLYMSSADWMPRNLNRRVELMFPIEDANVRAQVQYVLDLQWRDNVKAWRMKPDGSYGRVLRRGVPVSAQTMLMEPPKSK